MQLEIEGRTNDQVQTKEGPVKAQVATQLSEISDIDHYCPHSAHCGAFSQPNTKKELAQKL